MPHSNILLRNDTMLGVCQALGEDFGFHPNYLRVAFAAAFYFAPFGVIAVYLGLGALVAVSRYIAPDQVGPATPVLAASTPDSPTAPARERERLAA